MGAIAATTYGHEAFASHIHLWLPYGGHAIFWGSGSMPNFAALTAAVASVGQQTFGANLV
jgi:hypothetical protein